MKKKMVCSHVVGLWQQEDVPIISKFFHEIDEVWSGTHRSWGTTCISNFRKIIMVTANHEYRNQIGLDTKTCYHCAFQTKSSKGAVSPDNNGKLHSLAGGHMGLLPDTQNCECACSGNAGNVFPSPQISDPDIHHGTCVTHVPWCMPGSLTSGFLWNRRRGKTFPAFPAHEQPAILHIWQ